MIPFLAPLLGYLVNDARKALVAGLAGPLAIYMDKAWPVFMQTNALYVPTLNELTFMLLAGLAVGTGVWTAPNRLTR
jgi:hypothetical protein